MLYKQSIACSSDTCERQNYFCFRFAACCWWEVCPRTLHEGLAQNRLWGPLCWSAQAELPGRSPGDWAWQAPGEPLDCLVKTSENQREHLNKADYFASLRMWAWPASLVLLFATWEPWGTGTWLQSQLPMTYWLLPISSNERWGASNDHNVLKFPKFSSENCHSVLP